MADRKWETIQDDGAGKRRTTTKTRFYDDDDDDMTIIRARKGTGFQPLVNYIGHIWVTTTNGTAGFTRSLLKSTYVFFQKL